MIDYYEILEVSSNASLEVIRGAYKILLHRYDMAHDAEDRSEIQKLNNLNLAYEVLSDPDKREIYDIELQKIKNLQKAATSLYSSENLDNATTQNLAMGQSKQPPYLGHSGDKQSLPSFLQRVKWNRWSWSLSVLAVVVVLISMVRPDPDKVLRGQLAVKSHLEKKEIKTPFINTELDKQKSSMIAQEEQPKADSQPK